MSVLSDMLTKLPFAASNNAYRRNHIRHLMTSQYEHLRHIYAVVRLPDGTKLSASPAGYAIPSCFYFINSRYVVPKYGLPDRIFLALSAIDAEHGYFAYPATSMLGVDGELYRQRDAGELYRGLYLAPLFVAAFWSPLEQCHIVKFDGTDPMQRWLHTQQRTEEFFGVLDEFGAKIVEQAKADAEGTACHDDVAARHNKLSQG